MNYYTPTYIMKQIAAVKRVRELHKPSDTFPNECNVCSVPLPCATIKALDGENK